MRYLPHTAEDVKEMMQTVGIRSVGELFNFIPESLRLKRELNLPQALPELELRTHLRDLSRKNAHGEDWAMFLGGGSYSHYIPSAVPYLVSRGEFLTAYTPYQPEVSQGTLQAIFEYQTLMSEILGLEISNASNYDGSTAAAEAIRLAVNVTDRTKVLIARSLHPEYREVVRTYLKNDNITVVEIPFTSEGTLDRDFLKKNLNEDVACVVAGYPNFFGVVEDLSDVGASARTTGGLFITVTPEILSLGLFKSPGEMGADIAVAEGQFLGNMMSFGGPNLGVFATKKEYVRAMPGRLVGETIDREGKRGFVLTLATREQHIRREKATSNICTNVSLCALAATITLSLLGKKGFEELAQTNFDLAMDVREKVCRVPGVQAAFSGNIFNEFVVRTKKSPQDIIQAGLKEKTIPGIALGRWYPELSDSLLLCVTEMNSSEQIDKLLGVLKGVS